MLINFFFYICRPAACIVYVSVQCTACTVIMLCKLMTLFQLTCCSLLSGGMRTRQRARLEAVALAAVSEEAGNLQCVDEDRDESGSKDRDESDSKDRDESGSDEEIMPGSPNLPQLLAIEKSDPDHVVALDPGPQPDLYFSCDPDKMLDNLLVPLTRRRHGEGGLRGKGKGGLKAIRQEEVMKDCIITPDFERKECAPPITISKHAHKKIVKVGEKYGGWGTNTGYSSKSQDT